MPNDLDAAMSDSYEKGTASNNDGVFSEQQYYILGLLSKYSNGDVGDGDDETWIRRVPMLVFIFEGVVSKVLDYDYAPSFVFHDKTYYKLNVSQQFTTDLDELIMENLVRAIKLSTKWHTSGLAYQISEKGKALLNAGFKGDEKNPAKPAAQIMKDISSFTTGPKGDPITVEFVSGNGFFLTAPGMKPKRSEITETEDVSYVTSPWLPLCAVDNKEQIAKEMHSNAHRANEAAGAGSNIKDELEEMVALVKVHLMVAEWVPFGSNQIFALNDKLGSAERMQGGLFLAQLDEAPNSQEYYMPHTQGLTSVNVTDYSMDKFIAFKADIQYPEAPGIVQVEHFGVSCRDYGGCYYGMYIEAIQTFKAEHISVDLLSRVIVDITDDSSTLLDSLVSSYQRSLLETTFSGHSDNRSKYNLIMCEKFELPELEPPYLFADFERLMKTNKEYQNEVKQVTGDIQWTETISESIGIVAGTQGLLYVGDHEAAAALLQCYGALRGMSLFHQAFFRRIFTLHDLMHDLRDMIDRAHQDPNSNRTIRAVHAESEQVVLLLKQVMDFLLEALEMIKAQLPEPNSDTDGPEMVILYNKLKLKDTVADLSRRIQDMAKNIASTILELRQLYNGIVNIESQRMFTLQESIDQNTKNLDDAANSGDSSSAELEVLQVVLGGTLAFDIMDRFTTESILGDSVAAIAIWVAISAVGFFLLGVVLTVYTRSTAARAEQVLMLKLKLNLKVDELHMASYLNTKQLASEAYDLFKTQTQFRKIFWSGDTYTRAGKEPMEPEVTMVFDSKHGYILQVDLTMLKPKKRHLMMSEEEIKECFLEDLRKGGVLPPDTPEGLGALTGWEMVPEEEKASYEPKDD